MVAVGLFENEDAKIEAYESEAAKKKPQPVSDSVPEPEQKRGRGRPANEQERVPFTTRVRADVRKKINIGAATYDVKPSDIIDALVDQFYDELDWDKVGADRR